MTTLLGLSGVLVAGVRDVCVPLDVVEAGGDVWMQPVQSGCGYGPGRSCRRRRRGSLACHEALRGPRRERTSGYTKREESERSAPLVTPRDSFIFPREKCSSKLGNTAEKDRGKLITLSKIKDILFRAKADALIDCFALGINATEGAFYTIHIKPDSADYFDQEDNRSESDNDEHDISPNENSGNFTQLIKLYLEQNEISEFRDVKVFCELSNLLDLHLGDNDLNALHFNLSCLRHLRFLDLRRNKFTRVLDRDLHTMDNLAKHDWSVTVDFSDNPFECSCKLNPFIKWMKKTKVFIRNKNNLKCYEGNLQHNFHETKNCASKLLTSTRQGTTVILCFLSIVLVALVCALVYLQRAKLQKKIEPVLDSVSKRVRYTSIANGDTREDV
ncbi:uncharacterized protein LOC120357611 [Solenopsis invicta]|uniref:uncharacterized protein LOC120357611 n=1 Tax=Solenopsis invicta TaxID=13686 RepID=UPI00193EB3C4|nr:uncharacterized protein LOC120357611 [Solenopsis invicta]